MKLIINQDSNQEETEIIINCNYMDARLQKLAEYISITYTISIVVISVLNMCMYGRATAMYAGYLVQVFLLLVCCWGIEEIVDRVEVFNKLSDGWGITLCVLLEYGIMQLFSYFGNWYQFHAKNVILYSLVFFAIEFLARRAFYLKWKAEEAALNELIRKRNEN